MQVKVVDDQLEVDPALKYQISPELLRGDDVVHTVRASTGAVLQHHETGVRLLLPPHCFKCVDLRGHDVSDTQELQVVIRSVVKKSWRLKLRHTESLVSCVIEILPHTVPAFLRPVTLSIPHYRSMFDSSTRLVAVKVDAATGEGEDVREYAHENHDASSLFGQVAVEISSFGVFAVLSRSLTDSVGTSSPLEVVRWLWINLVEETMCRWYVLPI